MRLLTEQSDLLAHDGKIDVVGKKLELRFPYHPDLITELKWMDGARWNGSCWTVPDSPRSRMTFDLMSDADHVQRYFESPKRGICEPLRDTLRLKQLEMLDWVEQKRQCGLGVAMRGGKTLAYIEVMQSRPDWVWWLVAPKRVLAALRKEFRKWGFDESRVRLMTVHDLRECFDFPTKKRTVWRGGVVPQGIIYDEASLFKGPTSKCTRAAIHLASLMDTTWSGNTIRIAGTGTPQPKNYLDWWGITEIIQPGFLPWGNIHKFEEFLAVRELETGLQGQQFWKRIQWKDGSTCVTCSGSGQVKHRAGFFVSCTLCKGEGHTPDHVSLVLDRIKNIWLIVRRQDIVELADLPAIEAVPIFLDPDDRLVAVAEAIADSGISAIEVRSAHRQLSDGFRYVDKKVIRGKSNPKMDAFLELLDDYYDTGRFVVTAAYKAANTWLCEEAEKRGWRVIRCDSQTNGFRALWDDSLSEVDCLELFDDRAEAQSSSPPIVIVGHPKSLGYGTDLSASSGFCVYSSDDNGETFMQMIRRGHSSGMDRDAGCTIFFLLNLPTDELILRNLLTKKDEQDLSLAEIRSAYDGTSPRITQKELQGLLEMFNAEAGTVHEE